MSYSTNELGAAARHLLSHCARNGESQPETRVLTEAPLMLPTDMTQAEVAAVVATAIVRVAATSDKHQPGNEELGIETYIGERGVEQRYFELRRERVGAWLYAAAGEDDHVLEDLSDAIIRRVRAHYWAREEGR